MAKLWDTIGQKLGDLLDDLTTPDALREELARGVAAMDGGDPAAAEACFRRVVDQEDDNGRAWQLLGMSLLAQERTAEAIAALELAAARRSGDFELHCTLMEAERRRGDAQAALARANDALRAASGPEEMVRAYRAAGALHLELSAWGHALRELSKAAALCEEVDRDLAGELGRATYHAGDLDQARIWLSMAATATPPQAGVMALLARVLLELGQAAEAGMAVDRLLEQDPQDPEARLLEVRCMLARAEDRERTRQAALALLQLSADHPEAHALLGQVYAEAGDPAGAVPHLRQAVALEASAAAREQLLRRLLRLELELDEAPGLAADAQGLLELQPAAPLGLAALALAIAAEQPDRARGLLEQAAGEAPRAEGVRLVQGLIALEQGRAHDAAGELEAALRQSPGSARARRALRLAQQQRAELPPGGDLYPRLPAVARLLESHPALSSHAHDVLQVHEVFDRPLLICVMGEFNSGKSTLVNALIGEEVAAMGVTPTTATINLLKFGERRQARVIWRDDHEELLAWSEVREFLDGLNAARATEVRQVELLYPAEELLQVNVVDTPGLNSLVEGHERTARDVLARADAVIWLFSAQQAGKQTEKEALDLLARHRLKTVGVLNKIDRLSPEELAEVMRHLEQGFGELVDRIMPVSTRQALRGMTGDDDALLQQSRFPALRAHLEQSLFSRSVEVKRQATRQRLELSLGAAVTTLEQRLSALDRADAAVDRLGRWVDEAIAPVELDPEREALRKAHGELYRRGSVEVLEFVQPRRWALGEHRAAPADRDFLLGMLSEELSGLCDASMGRMEQRLADLAANLHRELEPLRAAGELERVSHLLAAMDQLLADRLALLREQVFTRYTAFARGWLAGGRVDAFLTGRLRRLELTPEAVFDALWEDRVDLKAELLEPLDAWHDALRVSLQDLLDRLALELELCRLELVHRYLDPLGGVLPS